jgi:hypothetical protein
MQDTVSTAAGSFRLDVTNNLLSVYQDQRLILRGRLDAEACRASRRNRMAGASSTPAAVMYKTYLICAPRGIGSAGKNC